MKGFRNWLVRSVLLLAGGFAASAFTTNDANTIFNAYQSTFFVTNNGNSYYKTDNGTGTGPGWWTFAEEIEMAEDAYVSSPSAVRQNIVSNLCKGFTTANGTLWTGDIYNDDMTWAVIAFARAYQITGYASFRNTAKTNFDAMFLRGWDTNFTGGGLWWNTQKGGKNACINGPAALAACYLYNIYGDSSYLVKASNCYAWERRVLFSTNNGAIDDSIATNLVINTWASTYNQGTFIGAGNLLYQATGLPMYYQDAILAAKYTQNSIASAGVLPQYGSGDFGGFNGIFSRWVARFARDQNLWTTFGPWLGTNANDALNIRNTNNLAWEQWLTATPAGTNVLASWDCSDSVVIMSVASPTPVDALQITPTAGFTAVAQRALAPNATSLSLVLTNAGTTTLNWSLVNTSAWLSVSSVSGTLAAAAPATNITVSLIPSATTNLAAGRYFANVVISNQSSGVATTRIFTLAISGGDAPIALTGFNVGLLASNNAVSAAPHATAFDIPNNYCFFQAGLPGATRGLPPDGVFTSQLDALTVFQLQPYGATTNALILGDIYSSSGTLTLANPQPYNSLSILACSANAGGGTGTFVVNFADGSQSPAINFNAQDWFNTTSNVAIHGIGRLKLGSGFNSEDDGGANPGLYQTTVSLAALGLNQPITSITFNKPANAAAAQTTGIFAVSGTVMPSAPSVVQQPLSLTNTQPAQGASFSLVASGVSPLAWQWYYSSDGINYAPLAQQTNASLTLSPVLQSSSAGSFFAVITNAYGAVTSSVATLSVYRAPVITQQPAPTNVFRFTGATNAWTVAANAALPVNYYWYQNGNLLPSATSATLQLNNLQTANSGSYTVVVSNVFGMAASSVATLAVAPAPTYPLGQDVLAGGVLGYWRLDETSGTTAHDYLGGNNGVYTAKVLLGQPGDKLIDTHASARFGYLGTSNSCVTNIAVDFSTTGNAAFSVEAWVNGGTQTTDAGLVTKGYGNGGEQFNLDCGGGSHAFRFFVRDAGGGTHSATSSVVPNNLWHHLVGVCDEVNGFVYLYVDGSNVAQTTVAFYSGILSSATPMSIGARQSGLGTAYDNQFIGTMEEVAVYSHALTSNQVLAHYQAATNRAPVFLANPFTVAGANAGQAYTATIAAAASDPNGDAITFAKVSGPAWLTVAGNGALGGTPYSADAGASSFVVRATDPGGLAGTATMNLTVSPAPPIVTSAVLQGSNVLLSWTGGIAPYQVQSTTNLAIPGWQNLGATVSGGSLLISLSNGAAFYRVFGQ